MENNNTNTPISTNESHSQGITFKVTPSQKNFILQIAARTGTDVSEYCRNAVLTDAISINQSHGQTQKSIDLLPSNQLPPSLSSQQAAQPTHEPKKDQYLLWPLSEFFK